MKVLIDLDSIRPNPNAGRTAYFVPGKSGPAEIALDADGRVRISKHVPYGTIYSIAPEPSHTYRYLPCEVRCTSCGAKFDHSALKADSESWGEDDETYSNEVCPRCGLFECLSEPLQYERLDEALRRRGGITSEKQEEDRCPHGMFYTGAGSCPKCGRGAE